MSAISRTALVLAISAVGLLGCFLFGAATTVAQEPDYASMDLVQPNPSLSDAPGTAVASDV